MAGAAALAWEARSQDTGTKKLRVGVVGTGNRSRGHHLPLIKKLIPEMEVAALCDITPEALAKGHEITAEATTYHDHRRMLAEQKNLDAVLVVVPNYVHAEIAVDALEAGKHVLVEKPLATHLADADRMMAAARKNQRVLQVGMQSRYSDGYRQMAQMIRDGAIGELVSLSGGLFRGDWFPGSWQYTDPATGKKTNWRMLTKTAGSALLEDGIHEIDVIHWLVNSEPTRIQAQGGNNVFRDRETIDNAGVLVEFANGARLTFAYTVYSPGVPDPRPLRIFGSKAEIGFERRRGNSEIVIQPYRGQPERIPVPHLRPEEAAWKEMAFTDDVETTRLLQAFAKSVTTGAAVWPDGQAGRDAIHISLAAERSLRTGRIYSWGDEAEL
jgi:predicted dehydrogenase